MAYNTESESVRIYRSIAEGAHSSDPEWLINKFKTSAQPPIRLAAAMYGTFLSDKTTEEQRAVFIKYLKERPKIACEMLIALDQIQELTTLDALQPFSMEVVNDLIVYAVRCRRTEAAVWLLRLKKQRYGFSDRDLSL